MNLILHIAGLFLLLVVVDFLSFYLNNPVKKLEGTSRMTILIWRFFTICQAERMNVFNGSCNEGGVPYDS